MTRQHAPDDWQLGNGHLEVAADAGPSGDDPLAAPRAALATLPDDLPLRGFDPDRHVIENVLADMA